MDKPSEFVEILHSNMRDATAKTIQQVVSGEVPVVNVEGHQAIDNETDIPLLTEELSPEGSNFSSLFSESSHRSQYETSSLFR